jgi:hypothetical protein
VFGDELNPDFVECYVKADGSVEFMVVCDHPIDPASPEPSDN